MANQMYDHTLTPVKGWPEMGTVDWTAPVDSSHTAIVSGSLISLDSDGEWNLGCASEALPYWALNGATDFDAYGESSTDYAEVGVTGAPNSTNTAIQHNVTGICVSNGYHLQTTEYAGLSSTFTPGVLLKASTGGDAGSVEAATGIGDGDIVGVCIRGAVTNEHGKTVVDFVQMWVPDQT